MHKKMMAAGGNMKKKMMAAGGSMMKKGYAAGGAMMKKKSYAGGGATSDYDITQRKYGGAGKKRTGMTTTKKKMSGKKPVVTKTMMTKAGVTNLRDFYNKMEVNAAGTGYKKRARALQKVGVKKKSDEKQRKSLQGKSASQIKRVSDRNKNKKETQFERIKRLNREAMAKTGGKSGRLKSS